MRKPAPVDHPVHELIRERWSPRAFAERGVEPEVLASVFEAARWAASCYNEQPWAFFVARREDEESYDRALSCLVEGNQKWARRAPVLGFSIAKREMERTGKENRHAFHDVGLASAQLNLEATARDLRVHWMAGIKIDEIREVFDLPEDWDPVAGFALGYGADPDELPEDVLQAEKGERSRRPLEELVFTDTWGQAAKLG